MRGSVTRVMQLIHRQFPFKKNEQNLSTLGQTMKNLTALMILKFREGNVKWKIIAKIKSQPLFVFIAGR